MTKTAAKLTERRLEHVQHVIDLSILAHLTRRHRRIPIQEPQRTQEHRSVTREEREAFVADEFACTLRRPMMLGALDEIFCPLLVHVAILPAW